MPAGDQNFCDHYRADAGVQGWINDPSSAAADHQEFFRQYKRWIDEGSKPGVINMLSIFGGFDTSRAALDAGDTDNGQQNGRVLATDCTAFNDFVAAEDKYGPSEELLIRIRTEFPFLDPTDKVELAFATGLLKYFMGDVDHLDDLETAALNGALFVQVDLSSADFATGQSDRRLFAIPGRRFFYDYGRPLTGLWKLIDDRMTDAFEKTGSRRINVTGVAQLRLGGKNDLFGPVNVGTGFTIKGRV